MAEIKYVITDEEGIHARPAGNLVKFVKGLGCSATITKGEKRRIDSAALAVLHGQRQIIKRSLRYTCPLL